jgi:hypothetical protein
MGRTMTGTERAIWLHDLALLVVRSKGSPKLEGATTVLDYRYGMLTIQYRMGVGQLDVRFTRKVLAVERFAGSAAAIALHPGSLGTSFD